MGEINKFLASSTIHGLLYISISKKLGKIFWVWIVVAGFITAAVFITLSFQSWSDSPVKTTIETLSINEITFPKITACPPRNTFTNLNYDLKKLENVSLTDAERGELIEYSLELLHDSFYDEILSNLSKLEELNQFYNWFSARTMIKIPSMSQFRNHLEYTIHTFASTGSVKTQYFNESFSVSKTEGHVGYYFTKYIPKQIQENLNFTLSVEIRKISLEVSEKLSKDKLYFDKIGYLEPEQNYVSEKYNPPGKDFFINLVRQVSDQELEANIERLERMPGFQVNWRLEPAFESHEYTDIETTKEFIRFVNFRCRVEADAEHGTRRHPNSDGRFTVGDWS